MVLNTKTLRTGEQICNGLYIPAYTDHLREKFGRSDAIGLSGPNLAAEIDANSLRVRIDELDIVIDIARRHGDSKTAESCVVRKSSLITQLDAMIRGGVPKPAAPPQVEPSRVTPVTIRRAITEDFQILNAIKLVRSYADDRIGLKEAKDLIEAVNAATPEWPTGLPPLRVRRVDDFSREMAAIGYQVRAVEAEDAPSTSGVYDVRIRWMEWTGKRPEMEDAIVQYTALKADDATCDAIHDGNAGEGPGAEFRQLLIRDYNTFCRKMKEYGYAVERLDASAASPQQDNPFTVRPPV